MYSDDSDEENPLSGFWMEGDSLAPPCQADLTVVHEILRLASPSAESVLYDLGCGDGRICLEAAKRFGCRSVGVEIESRLVDKFKKHICTLGLKDRVSAIEGDLMETDLSSATIVVCYLLPDAIELIKDKLRALLQRGTILVCNTWGPKGFNSVKTVQCGQLNATVTLHLYDSTSVSSRKGDDGKIASVQDANVEDILDYSVMHVAYCSKDKVDDEGEIPAIKRYISSRIDRVRGFAVSAKQYFMILSGSYGFLDSQDCIPYYDHLLQDDEVSNIVSIVSHQLESLFEKHAGVRTIKYYEVSDDPFVGPYRRVVELICEKHCISLEVIPTHE